MSSFWLNNPSILYENDNYLNFIPYKTLSRIEQMNAITRMMIYVILLLTVLSSELFWFQFPILVIIFIIVLYKLFMVDDNGKLVEHKRMEHVSNPNQDNDVIKREQPYKIKIESGYYDSDNKLHLGEFQGPAHEVLAQPKPNTNTEKYYKYKKASCKMPSDDNPYMNPTLNETMDIQVVEPCNVDDEKIKENIKMKFNKDLFQDVSDLFETKNSERQFFTIPPQQMPPDTVGLAKWLFNGVGSCKTDQDKCLRFEDLRYNPR